MRIDSDKLVKVIESANKHLDNSASKCVGVETLIGIFNNRLVSISVQRHKKEDDGYFRDLSNNCIDGKFVSDVGTYNTGTGKHRNQLLREGEKVKS